MIVQYASHNFTILSKSFLNPGGGVSGLAQRQPLARVCKSFYKHYLYNSTSKIL